MPLDSAKDSLPHVGLCGYSWTWSLWYQIDCFEHRCWHYFTATWAFARQPMAWEQVAVKWGLPATVRWHCGGNPPQHFSLDKLLRDHQPGEKPAALFLFSIGNADHARSSAASSKSRLETKCQQVPIATRAAVWWTDSFFVFCDAFWTGGLWDLVDEMVGEQSATEQAPLCIENMWSKGSVVNRIKRNFSGVSLRPCEIKAI